MKPPMLTAVDTQSATVSTSTQTYTCDEEEEKATKEIWEIIKEEKSWERCEEVMFRTWPSSAYRVTTEVDSNPLKLSGDRNLCVYVNNRVDINKGLAKHLREKINDLWELDGEGRPVEGITYMTQKIKKPNKEYTDKFTCMLSASSKAESGTGVTDMEKVYRHMEAIKEELLANGKERLAFIPLEGQDQEELRKMLEYLFKPNRKLVKKGGWAIDENIDVAMKTNSNIKIIGKGAGEGFVWLEMQEIVMYGCYISPNVGIERESMRRHNKEIIVGGDFNAKSYLWCSKIEDKRGEILADWMGQDDLVVHNQGDSPTFVRGASTSYIDITFSTKQIAKHIMNWKVLDDVSLSYHQLIMFEVRTTKPNTRQVNHKCKGWCIRSQDMSKLVDKFAEIIETADKPLLDAKGLSEAIEIACDCSFRKRGKYRKKAVYWWNGSLTEKRKECIRSRRLATRANKRKDEDLKKKCREELKKCMDEFKKAIMKAKWESWKELVNEVDNDVWGKGYKIAMNKLKPPPLVTMTDEQQVEIARLLFPRHQNDIPNDHTINKIQAVTKGRINLAGDIIKIKVNKLLLHTHQASVPVRLATQGDQDHSIAHHRTHYFTLWRSIKLLIGHEAVKVDCYYKIVYFFTNKNYFHNAGDLKENHKPVRANQYSPLQLSNYF
ncbi:unnamed protein product [Callosobruchus maculatus]|uniref:Endonuclease/exonuclease/phosphatase domain-containing protein n=1 Tax=Callosobruchus maculatus TaxID=64391 RepID=A0A653C638_CALMS|nr:unnamed protein product [Callosobruchus maculatus]